MPGRRAHRFTVDHVRITSRDQTSLAASVFTPFDNDEAAADEDDDDTSRRRGAAFAGHATVMVHAHPKFGGTPEMMHELAADMATHGMQVVNLSLRGVGGSSGAASWVGDAGEVHDVEAAAQYAHDTLMAKHVHLLGYSFGATVCGAALDTRPYIATYTAVAYPLGSWLSKGVFGFGAKLLMHHHTNQLKASIKPKLFLIGDRDDFTRKEAGTSGVSACFRVDYLLTLVQT